jgi:hypothetical protein
MVTPKNENRRVGQSGGVLFPIDDEEQGRGGDQTKAGWLFQKEGKRDLPDEQRAPEPPTGGSPGAILAGGHPV